MVEALVVVGALAVAAALLIPSMSRAREGERAAACLATLQRLGHAMGMYVPDQAGYLPGPTHINIPWNAGWLFPDTGQTNAWYGLQMTSFLAPYLSKTEGDARTADLLVKCPTGEGIPTATGDGLPWYIAAQSYYLVNTGSTATETQGVQPYYTTKPRHYFGFINLGSEAYLKALDLPPEQMPKKLANIDNHAQEWAIADLWYWDALVGRFLRRQVGTWPYLQGGGTSGAISHSGQLRVPSYPFHLTGKTYSSALGSDGDPNSPRLTTGRTNAVFFDGHAESVRNWKGSVNPCLQTGACD